MDIDDAARRLWRRLPVVLVLAALGAAAGFAVHASAETTYTSSTRLLLSATTGTSPGALADEVAAIATSPSRVETALAAAGASRDPAQVARRVDVDSVGSSYVVDLAVSDVDPDVAAALANSLAEQVVRTRGPLIDPTDSATEADPEAGTDADAGQAPGEQDGGDAPPGMIESARPATDPDPSRTLQDTVLGGLLGLIAGLGVAALVEMVRPSLTSPSHVALALDTVHLGEIPATGAGAAEPGDLVSNSLATAIAVAARRAGVSWVRVVAVDRTLRLEPVVEDLIIKLPDKDQLDTRQLLCVKGPASYTELTPSTSDAPTGVVVVAPSKLPRRTVEPAHAAVRLVDEPILGVVTYQPRSRSLLAAASPAGSPSKASGYGQTPEDARAAE